MIDRCNWLIDFTKGEISNVHPFVPGTPDMVLRYKKERGLYYVEEMELNGVKCSHVLIDTGYDRSDFFLSKQDIEQMSDACFLKKDTCYGFADTGNEISIYEVAQGEVNKMQFKNVTLATLASRRTMGISFFKRFSQVVLDTRKQEIRLYRHRNRCRGSSWFYIENGVRLFSRTCYRYWFGRVWRKYGGPDQTDESEKQYG